MKNKASNDEVFDAFSRRVGAQGGSVRSQRHAKGVVLYSYSTPIAFFPDEHDVPTFTMRKFSVTTSKQASQARAKFPTVRNLPADNFETEAKRCGADFAFAR